MKRLTTQLTALLLLLAGSSLSASAKVVVTDTLELLGNSDVTTSFLYGTYSTYKDSVFTFTPLYKGEDDTVEKYHEGNDAIEYWYKNGTIDLSDYSRLIVELDSASNDDIELRITNGGFYAAPNKPEVILNEGGTKFVFDLDNMIDSVVTTATTTTIITTTFEDNTSTKDTTTTSTSSTSYYSLDGQKEYSSKSDTTTSTYSSTSNDTTITTTTIITTTICSTSSINYFSFLTGYWRDGNAATGQTMRFKSIRLEKDTCIAEDYEEIDYSTGYQYKSTASLVEEGEYMNLKFEGGAWAYDISDIGTSAYEYLVVVPRYPWTDKCNYLGHDEIQYCLSDSVDYTYSITRTETKWGEDYDFSWGQYQRHRAAVFNINDGIVYAYSSDGATENDILDSDLAAYGAHDWTKLYLQEGYVGKGGGNEFELSAIYFTNTLPKFDNRYNYSNSERWDYYRTYTDSLTYGTVCLPYPSAVCGAYVYDVVGYGTDADSNPSELYLEEVTGVLKGGKAYIICSNRSQYQYTNTNNESVTDNDGYVTFTKAGPDVTDYDNSQDGLKGNTENSDKTIGSEYYILFADSTESDTTAVYKWGKGSNNTVGQYKAYLDLSVFEKSTGTEEAKANGWISMSLAYDGDDGTTGIKEIVSEEEDGEDDDAIYNLSGVRVTNPQKGIYIKNGKKYIIK